MLERCLTTLDKQVTAIVVAYKNRSDLAICYKSLSRVPEIREIIIVDNSFSEVGSCLEYAGLGSLNMGIVHAVPGHNLGYAGGNNLGIGLARERGAEHVLVCNPDVVVGLNTVPELLAEMDRRSLDLISPRLSEGDLSEESTVLSNPGWDTYLGRGVTQVPKSPFSSRYVPTFYGACFLASMCILDGLGGLSQDFFLYGEEIDYTLRIERSKFRWGVSEDVVVSHDRGSSISPGRSGKSLVAYFHAARSAVIVGRKYWPRAVIGWLAARVFVACLMLIRGRPAESRAVIRGLTEGLRSTLSN